MTTKKALCICNNCGNVLIDTNPQTEAMNYSLIGTEKELIDHNCPNCKTDSYLDDEILLEIAIGYEVAQMFDLKFGKNGKTKTKWGAKSVKEIGSTILLIIENQTNRIQ